MNRAELRALCADPDASVVRAGLAAGMVGDRVVIVCRDVPAAVRRVRDLLMEGPLARLMYAGDWRLNATNGGERVDFTLGGSVVFVSEWSASMRTRGLSVDVVLVEP